MRWFGAERAVVLEDGGRRDRRQRPGLRAPGFLAALLIGLLSGCTESSTPPKPPNLVLITLDTFRTDVLGTYGCREGLTPWLDRFGEEAVVFERATAPIGSTFPSHASLFTGLYPSRHGVRSNADGLEGRFTTLAEILQANGYETAAFSSMPTMLRRGGLGQGFAVTNGAKAEPGHFLLAGEEINGLAISWLEQPHPAPFFLWLHYAETHSPYRLTNYAREYFEETDYEGPLSEGASTQLFYSLGREIPWADEERAALRRLYAGEAAQLDLLVREVMDKARQLQLLEDTLVVITADHGQALGEHDQVGHGFLLWQPVVHIPLMIRLPAGAGRAPGRIPSRVSLIDLLPTVLEMLDLEAVEAVEGRSLMPALEGQAMPSRPYYVEARDLDTNARWPEGDAAALAVFLEDSKAIWRPDGFEVYDLDQDPLESGSRDSPLPEHLRTELLRLAIGFHEQSVVSGPTEKLSPEVEEELRALGYIQ
jgi:choline-sulfatase